MEEIVIVIPAYEPDILMLDLIKNLNSEFCNPKILIVNDGSKNADDTFKKASDYSNVIILKHQVNKGKGEALKTAFKYLSYHNFKGIIATCDADGQHKVNDIKKVIDAYKLEPKGLYIGSRIFKNDVPARSKFGNEATKFLFRLTNSNFLNDNQSGLRVFGDELIPTMIKNKGKKYEYEMNMLLELSRNNINISEVGIDAIYINGNSSSHFRPFRDFMKICRNIIKYALPGFISLIISITCFIIAINILKNKTSDFNATLYSAIIAIVLAYIVNYIIHRTGIICGNKSLFASKRKIRKYFLINSLAIICNVLIIVGVYALINNFAIAKTIGEIPTVLLSIIIKYLLVPTPKIKY